MIPINELKIGSYYNFDGRPIKLDGSFLAVYLQNEIDLSLEPIELTNQWFLDFGYKTSGSYYYISGHNIWICNDLFMVVV